MQFFLNLKRIIKKIIYKTKKRGNDFFIAVLLHFYENLIKSWLSNPKFGMMPDVTLILNSKMYIDPKFQVPIFKNEEVRRGVTLTPPSVE